MITATIRPPSASDADVETWLAEYRRSLAFWLAYPDPRVRGVVFRGNSGHPLEPLREAAAAMHVERPVEVISGPANEIPPKMHDGYAPPSDTRRGLFDLLPVS